MLLYNMMRNGISSDKTARALGLELGQVERAWGDFTLKEGATEMLRSMPPAPELVMR